MKHTKGPWTVTRPLKTNWDEEGDIGISAETGVGEKIIAETFSQVDNSGLIVPSLANAQLIAAAPDLLKALKSIMEEEFLVDHEGSSKCRAVLTKRKNAAYKAIAKAEGKLRAQPGAKEGPKK